MTYILTDGNNNLLKYPYSIGLLKQDNPNISFPPNPTEEQLASCNVFILEDVSPPSSNVITQNLLEAEPTLVDGVWKRCWLVVDASEEEVSERLESAWNNVRFQRNDRLSRSDWTQLSDAPVNREAWAEYRQQLRDIPQNSTDPLSITWPEEPV